MDLWNEDVFEVFLWTDERYPVYFEYEISPLNHELPILAVLTPQTPPPPISPHSGSSPLPPPPPPK